METKKTLMLALFPFLISLVITSCSTGGDSSGNQEGSDVTLTGTISRQTAQKAVPSGSAKMLALEQSADSVWAIPIAKMQGANIDQFNLMLKKTATPDNNGNFFLQLEKSMTLGEIKDKVPTIDIEDMPLDTVFDVDWLLVLMSGTTPLNVVELQGDAIYDGLMTIPMSSFTPESMNLGDVSQVDGVADLEVSSIQNDVTLSTDSLASLSRSDDIMETITDIIRNCDLEQDKCYSAEQHFVFMGDYENIITDYDLADSYSGYQIPFYLTDYYTKDDFDGICPESGDATVLYRLTPPGDVTVQGVTYNAGNPWDTGTASGSRESVNNGTYSKCFKNTLYVGKSNTSDEWMLQFLTGDKADMLTTDMPDGDWLLSRKGAGDADFTEIARFEFALAKPVDSNGNPIVFVPAIKFDTDGTADNGLTTVSIKWYQHNGTDYIEVTDMTLLSSLLGSFGFSMSDGNGTDADPDQRYDSVEVSSFDTQSLDISNLEGKGKFYYDYTRTDKYRLDYVGISYMYGGQSFRFAWTNYLN